MDVETRNTTIQELTRKFLKKSSENFSRIPTEVRKNVEIIFNSEKRSFREIVFTVNLARILDPNFKATKDLYACNPRPVYEQGIKPVLDSNGVPCTQSGPLNVTKATKAITDQWAAMKSPKEVGIATYNIVKYLDSLDKTQLEHMANLMGQLFMRDAQQIDSLNIESNPLSDSLILRQITEEFITQAMDGGNTAQRIIGILLELHTQLDSGNSKVHGSEDSASTTNLTSKKVGDLSVTRKSGSLISIYEVTLKEFSNQRIAECSQSLIGNLGKDVASNSEVIVLCRRVDVPSEAFRTGSNSIVFGRLLDRFGIRYNFVDIFEWINIRILELDYETRLEYFRRIEAYVNRVKTPVKVKNKWREIVTKFKID